MRGPLHRDVSAVLHEFVNDTTWMRSSPAILQDCIAAHGPRSRRKGSQYLICVPGAVRCAMTTRRRVFPCQPKAPRATTEPPPRWHTSKAVSSVERSLCILQIRTLDSLNEGVKQRSSVKTLKRFCPPDELTATTTRALW